MDAVQSTSPRLPRTPRLCLHRASGRAYVRLNGKMVYLGRHGSVQAAAAYEKLLADWELSGKVEPPPVQPFRRTTVDQVILVYLKHCDTYYRESPGSVANIERALAPLHERFGKQPAASFTPRMLKEVREDMVRTGWTRPVINWRVTAIKRLFGWAVEEALIPPSVFEGIRPVRGLKAGRCEAREPEPVRPIEWMQVEPILCHVAREVAAMIQLQWWCGARSGEITRLRLADIDRTGPVWLWTLARHKTAHAGRRREIPRGPRCQEILLPFIRCVPQPNPEQPLFSPQQAERERSAARRLTRRTKVQPSQAHRSRKPATKEAPRDSYGPNTYACAVARGIAAANARARNHALKLAVLPLAAEAARPEVERFLARLPGCATAKHVARVLSRAAKRISGLKRLKVALDPAPLLERAVEVLELTAKQPLVLKWNPHQLRHACATRVRREAGLESARVILGHADLRMAEHYAELDKSRALEIASRLG